MKVTGEPIYHKPEYDARVEAEISAYFDEVIFEPLFRLLTDAGVRQNSLEDWGWFPRGWGSLGIPRSDMPQISEAERPYILLSFKVAHVPHVEGMIAVKELQPTQDQFSREKVEKAKAHTGADRPLFISSDRHILDGHHQWVAQMEANPDKKIAVIWIDMEIRKLIDWVLRHWPMMRLNERPKKEHSALWDALIAGTVWYAVGAFTGKFNAAISLELRALGAKKTAAGFYLSPADLPMVLRGIVTLTATKSRALHEAILAHLDQAEANMSVADPGLQFSNTVDIVVEDLQKQLKGTVSSVEGLGTPPPNPPGLAESLREKLAEGANRATKKFSVEATQQLRAKVKHNLSEGGRTDRLVKTIEAEFGVSQRKVRVIAADETSQLVSSYRRTRYEALGCVEYIWDTSHDEKVRPTHGESNNHRVLDGRRFSWASPPVVDSATGRRRHPGEDYGPCRCVARPVFNFLEHAHS